MSETQIDMIFDLTEICPKCGKTVLGDIDKSMILFKNMCKECCDKKYEERVGL